MIEIRRKKLNTSRKVKVVKFKKKKKKAVHKRAQTRGQRNLQIIGRTSVFAAVMVVVILALRPAVSNAVAGIAAARNMSLDTEATYEVTRPDMEVSLLETNGYGRTGNALEEVDGIVIHEMSDPGVSAHQFLTNLGTISVKGDTDGSCHFIVGLDGEIIECIPCNEQARASGSRNDDTISINCCIMGASGTLKEETYDSLLHLTAWLVVRYGLEVDDILTCKEATGEDCPVYFTENSSEWKKFRSDVYYYIEARENTESE